MSLHHDFAHSRRIRAAGIHRLECRCTRCTAPRRPDNDAIWVDRKEAADELRGDLMAVLWGLGIGILLGALLCLYKLGI